jgi:hypothetical protein
LKKGVYSGIHVERAPMKLKQNIASGILVLVAVSMCGCATTRDLPAIQFVEQAERRVSLKDLRAGVYITVDVVVPSVTPGWRAVPLDGAGCQGADKNGLMLFPVVYRGQDVVYCPACDVGYCAPMPAESAGTLHTGTHRYVFHWRGERGLGPSHYARAFGAEVDRSDIEPGEYRITVMSTFVPKGAASIEKPHRIEASTILHVVK